MAPATLVAARRVPRSAPTPADGHPHVPRPEPTPQPVPLEAAGDAGHLHRRRLPVRRVRAGRGDRGAWRARAGARASGRRRSTCRTPGRARCVDIDVTLAVEGHQMTQARAVCHVGDREILTVNAALGDRPFDRGGQLETMPADVPPPGGLPAAAAPHCPATARSTTGSTSGWPRAATLDELDGTPGDGQTAAVGAHPRGARRRRRRRAGGPRRLRADGRRPGARHPRRRQQPRQHAARRATWCRPSGCCSTSASTPSSAASATASCTCSPRTARCWPPPARAASCATGSRRRRVAAAIAPP